MSSPYPLRTMWPFLIAILFVAACGGTSPAPSTLALRGACFSGATVRQDEPAIEVIDEPVAPSGETVLVTEAKRKRTRRGQVFVPAGYAWDGQAYDLVIHFHGAFETVETAFQASGVRAVLFTMNLGNGSGPYEDRFTPAGSFPSLLDAVKQAVATTLGVPDGTVRRIALSSWSAGYGAVSKILGRPADADQIDAVLLADSMHASLLDQRARTIYEASLAPFARFAEEAVDGRKLMVIAHSSIATTTYASTTEAADHLGREFAAVRRASCESPVEAMPVVSCVDRGDLHIRGYAGRDATAHVDQLKHVDATLLAQLRERWTS